MVSLARAKREGWLDQIRTASDEKAVAEGCYFDRAAADRVVRFFPQFLVHCKGEFQGKPFELLDWQIRDVIYPIFGWKRPNGFRRFSKAYIEIPKKNGKSTLAAGIGLYMLCADNEFGAHVYSAASDRQQAAIVHNEAINMVDTSRKLRKELKINRSNWQISFRKKLSKYIAISASPAGKEGYDGHCAICDELHVWNGRELWDALHYMGRARRQSLIFVITTAGNDMDSVCYDLHKYALGILNNDIEDTAFYPLVYHLEEHEIEGDKIYDRTLWRKCNPSMGFTIDEEKFGRELKEAMHSPRTRSAFLRYSFNIWCQDVTTWLPQDFWIKSAIKIESPRLTTVYGGLDLAKISDMSALALTEPLERTPVPNGFDQVKVIRDFSNRGEMYKENAVAMFHQSIAKALVSAGVVEPYVAPRPYYQRFWFWIPEEKVIDLEKIFPNLPFRQWAEKGFLNLTRGNVTDYGSILARIRELNKYYRIEKLAFDPWNAEHLTQQLEEDGIERVEFGQSMANFAHPTAEFERLLRAGLLKHEPNPVLDWQSKNVKVKTDASGNFRPVKPAHEDHKKIDGIVAGIMSLNEAMLAPDAPTGASLIY